MNSIHADTNKPSWADAPDWAQWLAQDYNCEWWWFDARPKADYRFHGVWDCDNKQSEPAGKGKPPVNWRETLERRPEQSQVDRYAMAHEAVQDDLAEWIKATLDGSESPPDLIIPSGLDFDIRFLREAREKGYRIEWDSSNGIRGWKE